MKNEMLSFIQMKSFYLFKRISDAIHDLMSLKIISKYSIKSQIILFFESLFL